jgi:lipoprotein-anchoring transpeptidase ErfK/SrfK
MALVAGIGAVGVHAFSRPLSTLVNPSPAPLQLAMSPPDGANGIAPDSPVSVTTANGRLTTVQVTDPAGHVLHGAVGPDGHSWTSTGTALAPDTTYTLAADAVDGSGHTQHRQTSFTTLHPLATLTDDIEPSKGTVGAGSPIVVKFNQPVVNKAAVQRALGVQMSIAVVGAWHWLSAKEVHYRPQVYWPTGDQVTVLSNLGGVDAGNGVWGGSSRSVSFTVGDAHISTVDVASHTMTVATNGQIVKTLKDSTGRDKYPTMGGVHLVLGKEPDVVMDSQSVGIPRNSPDGYYEHVFQDVNISDGGEFVHSAPWSVGAQGNSNVSHGCVNLAPSDATWFYRFSQPGDLVNVVNSPRAPEPGDHGTADWNMPWAQWVTGSAVPS